MVGTAKKKENSAASFLVSPCCIPPMMVAALLLIAYTVARPGPALIGLAGVLVLARGAEAQRPTAGGRALAAGDPTRAAAEFLKEAGAGEAKDTAFYNAGTTLLVLKRFDEAQRAFARTLEINPGHPDALGHLASAALRACDWETLEPLLPKLFSAVENGAAVPPLTLLALSDDPQLQKQCAVSNLKRNLAGSVLDGASPPALAPQPKPDFEAGAAE